MYAAAGTRRGVLSSLLMSSDLRSGSRRRTAAEAVFCVAHIPAVCLEFRCALGRGLLIVLHWLCAGSHVTFRLQKLPRPSCTQCAAHLARGVRLLLHVVFL